MNKYLSEGFKYLMKGDTLKALYYIEKAYYLEPDDPISMSYYGYLIASERGLKRTGLHLCEEAIKRAPKNPKVYLNLGRLMIKNQNKESGFKVIRKGLALNQNDEEIKRVLHSLGIRKKPVFSFLHRDNPINKYTGFVLHHLRLRK